MVLKTPTLQEMLLRGVPGPQNQRGVLSPVPQAPGRLIPPQPAQVLDPYGAELDPVELPISPGGGLVAAVPTLSEFVSRNVGASPSSPQASGSLDKEIARPVRSTKAVPVPPSPTLKAPPLRDFGREDHRAGDAMLTAGLFGLGLGSVGGVAAGPTLAAAAGAGSRAGADARFKLEVNQLEAQNKLLTDQYELDQDKFRMDELDANRAGDEMFRSDQLAQKREKDRADYLASLDGLDEPSLQAKLERDFTAGAHQGLGFEFPRRDDGTFDVSAVVTAKQLAQKSLEASRLADDEKAVLDVIRRTSPEGRQAALNALAPGLAARGSRFVQDATTGNWSSPGVDLASLSSAATGAWSPEALAARETADRNKAARAASLKGVSMLERFADDSRLSPAVAREIAGRTSAIAEALANGEVPAKELFLLPEGALAVMTPYQKEALADAQERLGLAREAANLRKRAQGETERKNKAAESDRDADRELRKIRPSANFQGAQSEYAQLREYRQKVMTGGYGDFGADDQAKQNAINQVNRRLGELESKYPVLGKGFGSRDSSQDAVEARLTRRTEEFRREFMKAQKEGNKKRVEQLQQMFRREFPTDPIPDGSVPSLTDAAQGKRTVTGANGKTYNVKKVN